MAEPSRRTLFKQLLAAACAGGVAAAADPPAHELPKDWMGKETIGLLMYPGFTALDLFGPHHLFISMAGAKVLLVAKDDRPVETDSKVKIHPTATFANCPEKLSVLFVPGGMDGTLAAAKDEATRAFVADRGAKADWITSVCTGSLVLGAAGLLRGYQATSHWMVRDELALFGAKPVNKRVVIDRNRMTGAGVTSGLDFGLTLLKDLRGIDYAQGVQVFSEYDPAPPLDAGSPEKCPPAMVKMLREMHQPFNAAVRRLAEETQPAK